jgi:hypothetical protein
LCTRRQNGLRGQKQFQFITFVLPDRLKEKINLARARWSSLVDRPCRATALQIVDIPQVNQSPPRQVCNAWQFFFFWKIGQRPKRKFGLDDKSTADRDHSSQKIRFDRIVLSTSIVTVDLPPSAQQCVYVSCGGPLPMSGTFLNFVPVSGTKTPFESRSRHKHRSLAVILLGQIKWQKWNIY